jgi:signal transduction histidine kinase
MADSEKPEDIKQGGLTRDEAAREASGRGSHWFFGLGTLSARVIALSAAMTIAILGIAFALTYLPAQHILEEETSQVVDAELQALVDQFREGGERPLVDAIAQRAGRGQDAIYLLEGDQGPEAGNITRWPQSAPPENGDWFRFKFRNEAGQEIEAGARAILLRSDATGEPRSYRLLVGRDFRAQRRFSATLGESAALALLAAGLLAVVGGFIINRMVMRRIGDIEGAARAIVAGDLTRRVPQRRESNEFSRLSLTLNAMLERIETLVVELRTVTDSLAHDLRTPLTRLKTQISRAADKDLTDAARREAVAQASDEADRILSAFSAMIDLARAEAGAARSQFVDLDLAEVVRDVVELHQPLADDMGVTLSYAEEPAPMRGHAQFIAQLTSNLLDNALKHGASGGEIAVSVSHAGGRCVLTVADRGPGVPAEMRDVALKRFGRLDDARSTPGSGLGLSLAETIARMHDGALALEDNAPGLRVRVDLPARA